MWSQDVRHRKPKTTPKGIEVKQAKCKRTGYENKTIQAKPENKNKKNKNRKNYVQISTVVIPTVVS